MASIPPENKWAMVPASVIFGLTCSDCLKLYCALDLRQGKDGYPWRGVTPLAKALGWKPLTVRRHAEHLAEAGLIELNPPPRPNHGWSEIRFKAHNPARGRGNRTTFTERWVEHVPIRWKRGNPTDGFEALRGGTKDASSGYSDDPKEHHNEVPLPRSNEVWEGSDSDDESSERFCECGEPIDKISARFCAIHEEF